MNANRPPEAARGSSARISLVSHALCPYVQRAAIVLAEKGVPFERIDIDLARKPEWFLRISPLGKTPVLLVNGTPVFESAAICEYLDETEAPRLHPEDALERAQHRGWMEFGSTVLHTIWGFYTARDAASLAAKRSELRAKFEQLEAVLPVAGPWFAGTEFRIVDAVFGPAFRYLDTFEALGEAGWLDGLPRMQAWRGALAVRPSVRQAVQADYPRRLREFLLAQGSALSSRMAAEAA